MASSDRYTSRSSATQSSDASDAPSSRWKVALIGVLVMAIAALLGLAFLTYHPEDDPLTKQLDLLAVLVAPEAHQAVYRVQNALGLTGAELARRGLREFVGYPVLLPTATLMLWGFVLLRLPSFSASQLRWLGRTSALAGTAALLTSTALGWLDHALGPPGPLAAWAGDWGLGIAGWMHHLAGTVGSLFLLVLMGGIVLVLTLDLSLTKTLRRGKRGVEWGSEVADAARQRVVPVLRRLQSRAGDPDDTPALPPAPLSLPAADDANDTSAAEDSVASPEATAVEPPPPATDTPSDASIPGPSPADDTGATPDDAAQPSSERPPADDVESAARPGVLDAEQDPPRADAPPEEDDALSPPQATDASEDPSDGEAEHLFGDVLADVPSHESEPDPEAASSPEPSSVDPHVPASDADLPDTPEPPLDVPTFSLDLLEDAPAPSLTPDGAAIDTIQQHVVDVLASFNVTIDDTSAVVGSSVVRFDVTPGAGTLPSHIKALADDLPDALGVASLRMVTPDSDAPVVGIELPRPRRHPVPLRSLLTASVFQNAADALPLALGQSITGHAVCPDLASLPHLLTAGAPRSGRVRGLHALLLSLLRHARPSALRMVFIDPDDDTLAPYAPLHPHYGAAPGPVDAPVVSALRDIEHTLMACERELDARLAASPVSHTPRLVVVVSNIASLLPNATCTDCLIRLLHEGASAGIHLLLSTVPPTSKSLPRRLRGLLSHRVAYAVPSRLDSRTVLDAMGAERLLGAGDLLYRNGPNLDRLQGPLVDGTTVTQVVDTLCARSPGGTYTLS